MVRGVTQAGIMCQTHWLGVRHMHADRFAFHGHRQIGALTDALECTALFYSYRRSRIEDLSV